MNETLLRVLDLTVTHRNTNSSRPAVNRVSFDLSQGSTLGIVGESGAGKSSLALALMGLHDSRRVQVSGSLLFRNTDLLKLSEEEYCRVRGAGLGMIFQDSTGALDPSMRVEDQLAAAIRMHADPGRQKARELARSRLSEVGITKDILDGAPYAYQLSGGLCQRAMIAMALACDPDVLIADEPTSSLDVTLQSQIIALLTARQKETGLAIVFISHDLALVSLFADDVLVLHKGETVEQGKCSEVLANPGHPYTRSLISAWITGYPQGDAAVAPA